MSPQQKAKAVETALRTQIDAAIAANPGTTFPDVLDSLQEAIERDIRKNPRNDAALFMRAVVNVMKHYHTELTIQGDIRE